jgi:16S rRNA (cytosine967-C5)-methyltransferase
MTAKQAAILRSAARLLKPGGRLVYATCSVLPQENEAIAEAFTPPMARFRPSGGGLLEHGLKVERRGLTAGPDGRQALPAAVAASPPDGRFFRRRWERKESSRTVDPGQSVSRK